MDKNLQGMARAFAIPHIAPELSASKVNPAMWTYQRLTEYIKDFESKWDENHEIGAGLTSFGTAVTFHIEDMGYYGPDIICFHGKNDLGEAVQLIQHTSQLSVLLVTMKKRSDKPRRIGFILDRPEPSEEKREEE